MKVGKWSTTAGNNNATPPDGWPEGQAPSTVNDCARENMAAIKTLVNSLEYVDLDHTPSFLTSTTFSLAAADTANFEIGRRLKLFDATTLYGTIISVSATQVQVRLDSGALTSNLSSVALSVIKETNNSLPEKIWNRRNVIINGQMDVWQRGPVFQCANNTKTFLADRFGINLSTGAAVTVSRSERSAAASNVPTLAQVGMYLNNSLLISVSAVDATIAAGEFAFIEYLVEGYDWKQIAHKPMNLSFWVNTNKSGTYAVSFRNTGNNTCYVQNYTVSAVATWTKFSIPVPEAPTTGTWDYSSGIGLKISWALAIGSTYQGGAANWTAANILATSTQVNFLISAGNTFALTGIQLESSNNATPLEIRPYGAELAMCQRYYMEIPDDIGTSFKWMGYAVNTSQLMITTNFPVMRGIPGVIFPTLDNIGSLNSSHTSFSTSAIAADRVSNGFLDILATAADTPFTLGLGGAIQFSAGSVIALSSEPT
jgi:hypothetical protein